MKLRRQPNANRKLREELMERAQGHRLCRINLGRHEYVATSDTIYQWDKSNERYSTVWATDNVLRELIKQFDLGNYTSFDTFEYNTRNEPIALIYL